MAKRPTAKPVAAVAPDEMSLAQKIAWYSLLALVFLVPLAMSNLSALGIAIPLTYDQFDIPKLFLQRVFALAALAGWGWHMLTKGGKVRYTPVEILILVFLAWVALSSMFSIHVPTALFGKYRRFEGLFSFINYAIVYFLAMQFADRPSRIKRIAQALFFSGALVALNGILQYFGADPSTWGALPFEANRAFATYGNPDLLGGFLCFSVFVSLGLALAEKDLIWRGVYWTGFLMNSFVLIVAFVRGAWIGAFVGFILFAILAWRQRAEFVKEDWVFAGVSVAAVVGAIVRSLSADNEVMNFAKRLSSITKFDEGSAKTRFQIWDAAISAIQDKPIFGFGADTFRLVFPKYKPVEYVADAGYLSVADNVHNYPLQAATGIGIPGVALLYSVFGWAAVRSGKVVWAKREEGGPNMMILVGFWVACAAYLTHLFFGLSVTGVTVFLWLSMGILLSPTAKTYEYKPGSMGYVAGAVLLVAAAAGIIFHSVYIAADNSYLQSRILQGEERVLKAEEAARLNPWNDMYRAEVALAYSDLFYAYAQRAQQALSSGDSTEVEQVRQAAQAVFIQAEAALLDTIAFIPPEYDNYVFAGGLYNAAAPLFGPTMYEKAVQIARTGIEVEQFGPAIRYQLAYALTQQNKLTEAEKELRTANDMDPAYVDAATLLAQVLDLQGKRNEAIQVLDRTAARVGEQPAIAQLRQLFESTATTTP